MPSDLRPTAESLREYGRGIAGGLLFSLPLLYTLEVWWAGFTMSPVRQLVYVGLTLVLLLGYNRFAGLREDSSWLEVWIDSVEEFGIGVLLSALILYLLGRIHSAQHVDEILGRIVVEGMTVAIGVSVGTAQLGGGERERDQGKTGEESVSFGGQLTLAFCGAVLFAANVAPTEEILILGIEMSPVRLLGLASLSMLLAGLILFYSDFRGARQWAQTEGIAGVLRGMIITYAAALTASAVILWLFGRFDGEALSAIIGQTVVLGLAASLGASAGRLLLQ